MTRWQNMFYSDGGERMLEPAQSEIRDMTIIIILPRYVPSLNVHSAKEWNKIIAVVTCEIIVIIELLIKYESHIA